MDFKKERVDCHNKFPQRVDFKAEVKFRNRLNSNNGFSPFKPIQFEYNNDVVFQTCMGHLIDGLEFLPFRPDYMFDHCFKVIDEAGCFLFRGKGIKGIAQGLGVKLLNKSKAEWEEIINILGQNIPLMTCRFIVKNLCEAHFKIDNNSEQLVKRAKTCFGTSLYNEFMDKFAIDDDGIASGNVSIERIEKASSFLKLYLSGKKATKNRNNTLNSQLDLNKEQNLPTANQRIELILSLLLFHMRNERAHGSVISPFKTSKSSLNRYQSYYYAMLCSYIFCLGILHLRGFGILGAEKIKECCKDNIDMQNKFFS